MKKMIALLLLVFLFTSYLKSQTVDNIKVEQAGDFIKVRYQILNSTVGQTYRVKVLCSINGGMNTEIRSITGDVGDQVAGGKPEYWVLWDVLKDVDELQSVEFIVRAELISGKPTILKNDIVQKETKRFYALASVEFPNAMYGLRLGFMGKMGVTLKYLQGTIYWEESNFPDVPIYVYTTGIALTIRIVRNEKMKMHIYGGWAGMSFNAEEDSELPGAELYVHCLDAGFIWAINRFTCQLGIVYLGSDGNELGGSETYGSLGVGFRF